MDCSLSGLCGGCSFRHLGFVDYQHHKLSSVKNILQSITRQDFVFAQPIFINDGCHRRASMAFRRAKKAIKLGFNGYQSNELIAVENCNLLTAKINDNLEFLRSLLLEVCQAPITVKLKKKKSLQSYIDSGDLWITEADNGLDIVLEFAFELNLELRQIIFEQVQKNNDIIRVSHRKTINDAPQTIMEKVKPYLKIADREVYIPAGTFLQPSKQGEQALVALVQKYLSGTSGKIADLFCGVGTFSYPLSQNLQNKIIAIDSSPALLAGFQDSINRQMIPNIELLNRNLFKYPLQGKELSEFAAIVFDPPRAGAKEQVTAIANLANQEKPKILVAISCNPHSFTRDANILIAGGYRLEEITLVDQFTYSIHSELVAKFVYEQ